VTLAGAGEREGESRFVKKERDKLVACSSRDHTRRRAVLWTRKAQARWPVAAPRVSERASPSLSLSLSLSLAHSLVLERCAESEYVSLSLSLSLTLARSLSLSLSRPLSRSRRVTRPSVSSGQVLSSAGDGAGPFECGAGDSERASLFPLSPTFSLVLRVSTFSNAMCREKIQVRGPVAAPRV
jgi:hypothetical protein